MRSILRIARYAFIAGALGGICLQAPTCTDISVLVATGASVVTAGGMLYLVSRVVSN